MFALEAMFSISSLEISERVVARIGLASDIHARMNRWASLGDIWGGPTGFLLGGMPNLFIWAWEISCFTKPRSYPPQRAGFYKIDGENQMLGVSVGRGVGTWDCEATTVLVTRVFEAW